MKRTAAIPDDKGKRAKRSLEFLGTCLSTVHLLSDSGAWRAAKAAAASGDVVITYVKECASSSTLCLQGSVTAPSNVAKVAAAAHAHPFPGQAQVQLLVDTRSGELLDADTSCCPGGYHAARGSFCPCMGALLLAAAQLQTLEHGERQELALAHWSGTDALAAREHVSNMAGKLQQLVQPGLLQQVPAQLLQEVEEVEVLPATHTQARLKGSSYDGYATGTASPDAITSLVYERDGYGQTGPLLSNVASDLPQQKPGQDSSTAQVLPPALRQGLDFPGDEVAVAAMAAVAAAAYMPATPAAVGAAAQNAPGSGPAGEGPLHQAQLLAALGGGHLTSYMGKVVSGWEQRPKVINWAFGMLLSAVKPSTSTAAGCSGAAAGGPANVIGITDAKPLVALTGLLRVLWHCTYVEGLPAQLRGVLLVAMALRNLLLVVALPVWARKAVAAQLRAWQEAIIEAHACRPVMHTGNAKLVHLLRVLKEAELLCQHGWDHPSLSAALQSVSRGSDTTTANTKANSGTQQQPPQQQQPASTSKQALAEHPGLVLLRLAYLELTGQKGAYLDLAMAGKQWSHAVSALLRSGDRSQLRLAAELLPRHITSLPQRLDYMQQLLGLEELPVVERCELAARLLLSLRADLVPRPQQPVIPGPSRAWWQVHLWEVPDAAQGSKDRLNLQSRLNVFLRKFFTLAGQAQFSLAKEAMASRDAARGAAAPAAHAAAAAAGGGGAAAAAGSSVGASATAPPAGAAMPPYTTRVAVTAAEARTELTRLPPQQYVALVTLLHRMLPHRDVGWQVPPALLASLRAKWGERTQPIIDRLAVLFKTPGYAHDMLLEQLTGVGPKAAESPSSPLELDTFMLQQGEPSCRRLASSTPLLDLDELGFVKGIIGVVGIDTVEPFPLPNLLPLCGLAPAALHAVVEQAMAPLVDAAFRPSTTSTSSGSAPALASSRPGDLADTLLQVAGHPGVELAGASVRLQMAVEMVAYAAALTPLATSAYDPLGAANTALWQPLLYGLLAMGQRDLASTVAMAAYRVCPSRFTATYLLLLAIPCGYAAQAAAVDWILGKDWPAAAGGAEEDPTSPVDLTGGSPQRGWRSAPTASGGSSSLDTQQLLGSTAAEAIRLTDTACSRAKHDPSYTAGRARKRTPQQRAEAGAAAGGAPAGEGGVPGRMYLHSVEATIRRFVEEAQDYEFGAGIGANFEEMVAELAAITGVPPHTLEVALEEIRSALHMGEELIYDGYDAGYPDYIPSDDYEMEHEYFLEAPEVVDPRINQAVWSISQMARDALAAPGAVGPGLAPSAQGGAVGAAQVQAATTAVPTATLVLEHELLGATGAAWRERARTLRSTHLQPVIQYTAACGLHPDLVTRLALVELGCGPGGFTTPAATTWEEWMASSQMRRLHDPRGILTTPQVAFALDTPQLRVAPGASIQEVTDKYAPPVDSSMFAAWLLRWVQGNPLAADHGARSSSSGSASSNSTFASSAGPCRAAPLLRQLWLLLQGRCYSPWMLWVAAALDRVGEQQLACEAAAQGMLPGACSLLDIKNVQKAYASCLTAILPQLAQSGDPAVLQQAAATQLLMAQAPVPVKMLMGQGVLERLLDLTTQLAVRSSPASAQGSLQVPAICIDLATGKLSLRSTGQRPKDQPALLGGCDIVIGLLQRCAFAPLGGHVNKVPPLGRPPALRATLSSEEESVVALLEGPLAKLHWSTALCILRAAREAGAIGSWPGLVRLLAGPLAAAAEAFSLAASEDTRAACTTLVLWRCENVLHLPPLVSKRMEEAGGWVNGVLAWITVELGAAILDKGKPASQPPTNCVEELSSCLLGFCTPHITPYTTAALQVLQGRSTADITRALVPNGVLPLVGRPENLQASTAAGGARSPYWAWGQTCYTQALHCLLQQGQLLASLPPATIKNMALTYWVKCGTLEAMAWVGQLLDWLQQRCKGSQQGPTGATGRPSEGAASQEGPNSGQAAASPLDVLSIQVHPELAPFLDLAPASGPHAAIHRFLQLQTAAARQDLVGALSALLREPPEMLGANFALSPAQYHHLEQQMLELEGILNLLDQQPYAGSPAVSWLQQQPEFQHIKGLLRGLPPPSVMDAHIAALTSPLLRLRVVQLKLWKLSRAIRGGPPSLLVRLINGPPKPWQDRLTSALTNPLPEPSYIANAGRWGQLLDADLEAAFQAARADIPGPAPLPRQQMLNNVLAWQQAQEVALAWAVVKYAELRGHPSAALGELRSLVQDPVQLGQLPVFMAQLGAAVKHNRARYPLYALFRRVVVRRELHQYVWGKRKRRTFDQLKQHLANYNHLTLQQLMVQVMPWLDWQAGSKTSEVNALAEWLWWLSVLAPQQKVVGADVTMDQPAHGGGNAGWPVPPGFPYRPVELYAPGYMYM